MIISSVGCTRQGQPVKLSNNQNDLEIIRCYQRTYRERMMAREAAYLQANSQMASSSPSKKTLSIAQTPQT